MTVVGRDGAVQHSWVLGGHGPPGLDAADEVARRALWATRTGGRLVLTEVTSSLRALVARAALPVAVCGDAAVVDPPGS